MSSKGISSRIDSLTPRSRASSGRTRDALCQSSCLAVSLGWTALARIRFEVYNFCQMNPGRDGADEHMGILPQVHVQILHAYAALVLLRASPMPAIGEVPHDQLHAILSQFCRNHFSSSCLQQTAAGLRSTHSRNRMWPASFAPIVFFKCSFGNVCGPARFASWGQIYTLELKSR